ncbi:MAG: gliding motility-associated peptidyl-prolyl isomerase GldI [Flavobacteriaceae bacterium]
MKNLNSMFRIFFLLIFLTHLNCQNLEPRRPINKQKQVFLKESAKRNKNIIAIEQSLFQHTIEQEKKLSFKNSPQGFWYAYQKKNDSDETYPKKGDLVSFKYRIEDLNGNLIYDEKELGNVSFLIDQEDLIPALREGVKYLRPEEIGVFLFPSYLCYGYQGDGEKIGINQPLRFTIELLKLKKN